MSRKPEQASRTLAVVSGVRSPALDRAREAASGGGPVDVRLLSPSASGGEDDTQKAQQAALADNLPPGTAQVASFVRVPDGATTERALLDSLPSDSYDRVFVDSDCGVDADAIAAGLGDATVERVDRSEQSAQYPFSSGGQSISSDRRRLLHPGGLRRIGVLFALSYLFYLGIGGFVGGLDFVTGAISAGIVAISFARVTFGEEPAPVRMTLRFGRFLCFLPVLIYEIVTANLAIAAIILHPSLPISPVLDTVETETREGFERMVLANSITLTPGTVVVDVDEETFTVHALTSDGLDSIPGGKLERLVAWVFHGGDRA